MQMLLDMKNSAEKMVLDHDVDVPMRDGARIKANVHGIRNTGPGGMGAARLRGDPRGFARRGQITRQARCEFPGGIS